MFGLRMGLTCVIGEKCRTWRKVQSCLRMCHRRLHPPSAARMKFALSAASASVRKTPNYKGGVTRTGHRRPHLSRIRLHSTATGDGDFTRVGSNNLAGLLSHRAQRSISAATSPCQTAAMLGGYRRGSRTVPLSAHGGPIHQYAVSERCPFDRRLSRSCKNIPPYMICRRQSCESRPIQQQSGWNATAFPQEGR